MMTKTRVSGAAIAIITVWLVSACAPTVYQPDAPDPLATAQSLRDDSAVYVRFLGVGGFYIRRGRESILTAPLYSNPKSSELLGPIEPNTERIEQFRGNTPDVKAIFVGHAHYDHLMDVPYVWKDTDDAVIYGNISTKNILSGFGANADVPPDGPRIPAGKVRAVNATNDNVVDYRMCVEREGVPPDANIGGAWVRVPGTRIRFRALCSEHPPQLAGAVHLWPGGILRPRFRPPDTSQNFQEGETHAFLIDFMNEDGTAPAFRIYYQDAPTNVPIGEVHPSLIEEKRVDLALLCVGNFVDVIQPTHIVTNTDPRFVILGHWENFFRAQDEKLKPLPGTRTAVKQVEMAVPNADVYLPAPQAWFEFWPDETRLASR